MITVVSRQVRCLATAALMLGALPWTLSRVIAADALPRVNPRSLVGTLFSVNVRDLELADRAPAHDFHRNFHGHGADLSLTAFPGNPGHAGNALPVMSGSFRPVALRFDRAGAGERAAAATDQEDLFPHSRVALPMVVAFPPVQNAAASLPLPRPLVGPVVGVRSSYTLRVGMSGIR